MIRPVRPDDAAALAAVYNPYVRDTVITFEETEVTEDEMRFRIGRVSRDYPWLVAEDNGQLTGYAYAAPWKERSAYRFTVETTVYVDKAFVGRGVGTALYRALLTALETFDVHVAVACIALPNEGSQALHEKLGFRQTAHFQEVGYKFDRWVDVGYWELLLKNR